MMSQRNTNNRTEIPCGITSAAFLFFFPRKKVKSRQPEVRHKNRNKIENSMQEQVIPVNRHARGSWKFCQNDILHGDA
jgi:hypothetical protein